MSSFSVVFVLVMSLEVSDVCNAVYDGADAVMTSGETAKGKYPDATMQMMNEIILSAEHFSVSGSLGSLYTQHYGERRSLYMGADDVLTAAAKGAVEASLTRKASAIIVMGDTGRLTSLVAAYRPTCPIISFVPSGKIARQLMLTRAVYPVVGLKENTVESACTVASKMGLVSPGDFLVTVQLSENRPTLSFDTV
jgi:pyruvate kinase